MRRLKGCADCREVAALAWCPCYREWLCWACLEAYVGPLEEDGGRSPLAGAEG